MKDKINSMIDEMLVCAWNYGIYKNICRDYPPNKLPIGVDRDTTMICFGRTLGLLGALSILGNYSGGMLYNEIMAAEAEYNKYEGNNIMCLIKESKLS